MKIDDLAKAIEEELQKSKKQITENLQEEVKNAAELARKELLKKSPKEEGDYRKGWKVTTAYQNANEIRVVTYNKKKPQLTHLLEHGHKIVTTRGEVKGEVPGIPHIAPAQKLADDYIVKATERM